MRGADRGLYDQRPDPAAPAVVADRLAREPDDVALRRIEQYLSPEGAAHAAVCARDRARALEKPDDADRADIALRCQDEGAERDAAFLAAHARWPANAWLAYGAAWALAGDERWSEATAAFEQAGRGLPFMADQSVLMQARILRAGGDAGAHVQALAQRSEPLARWLAIESPDYRARDEDGPIAAAYADLARDRLAVPAVGDRLESVVAVFDGATVFPNHPAAGSQILKIAPAGPVVEAPGPRRALSWRVSGSGSARRGSATRCCHAR